MSQRGRFPHRASGRRRPRHGGGPFGGPGGPEDDHMFGDMAFGDGWSDEGLSDDDFDGGFPGPQGPQRRPPPRYAIRGGLRGLGGRRAGFGSKNRPFPDSFDDSDEDDFGPPPGRPFGLHGPRGGFGGPPGMGPAMMSPPGMGPPMMGPPVMGPPGMARGGFGPMGPALPGSGPRAGRRGGRGPRRFM